MTDCLQAWQKRGEGHRGRLRDRFLKHGLEAFSDIEILELLLSFGTPRSDCKQQAKLLLERFGGLAAVLDAQRTETQQVHGIGPKNSFALSFIKSVADRYLQERIKKRVYVTSAQQVIDYLTHTMRGLAIEVFTVIYLDASLGIIDSERVAEGTVNVNTIYPREIIKKALQRNAAAIIVAHNHPSGSLKPSRQDHALTKTLGLLCALMQIRLIDHIIIGSGHFSFADEGLMAEISSWSSAVCNGDVLID